MSDLEQMRLGELLSGVENPGNVKTDVEAVTFDAENKGLDEKLDELTPIPLTINEYIAKVKSGEIDDKDIHDYYIMDDCGSLGIADGTVSSNSTFSSKKIIELLNVLGSVDLEDYAKQNLGINEPVVKSVLLRATSWVSCYIGLNKEIYYRYNDRITNAGGTKLANVGTGNNVVSMTEDSFVVDSVDVATNIQYGTLMYHKADISLTSYFPIVLTNSSVVLSISKSLSDSEYDNVYMSKNDALVRKITATDTILHLYAYGSRPVIPWTLDIALQNY